MVPCARRLRRRADCRLRVAGLPRTLPARWNCARPSRTRHERIWELLPFSACIARQFELKPPSPSLIKAQIRRYMSDVTLAFLKQSTIRPKLELAFVLFGLLAVLISRSAIACLMRAQSGRSLAETSFSQKRTIE
jgi:hypothetical protein